jgi:hypothetical protein
MNTSYKIAGCHYDAHADIIYATSTQEAFKKYYGDAVIMATIEEGKAYLPFSDPQDYLFWITNRRSK